MNFLAHAWLARGGDDDFLYGNLIADGVKGSDLSDWPMGVACGIRHHRRVDAYVDGHPVTRQILTRSPPGGRRVMGIALDLVWDHFVARELILHDAGDRLVERTYRLLAARSAPARLAPMVPPLVEQDWLRRYADFPFTCRAIDGIGRRLTGPNRLAELLPWLEAEYSALEGEFHRLWVSVRQELEVSPTPGAG
ncbi:Acyl carrier protein phosphodiesterase [Halomonas shengliensis]|uniref:Acyl carrier protein phosphodiesterase n=1 Tax=Halomonas shengliensis TaxID=419597 RepID=A0A1H0GMB4_9GAMM|nr:ACP phosphodiesterase [Halomonas shengliensis]SDO08126.1 Acyl carrier protein phosphodiesterase [Halomonas shengliensis]